MFTLTNIRQELDQVREKSSAEEFSFSKNSFVWDSGKVKSTASVYVTYDGKPLDYDTQYFWTVKVWTNKSNLHSQSKISHWKTGLMESENWKSDWITVQSEDKDSAKSPYFINDFNNVFGFGLFEGKDFTSG